MTREERTTNKRKIHEDCRNHKKKRETTQKTTSKEAKKRPRNCKIVLPPLPFSLAEGLGKGHGRRRGGRSLCPAPEIAVFALKLVAGRIDAGIGHCGAEELLAARDADEAGVVELFPANVGKGGIGDGLSAGGARDAMLGGVAVIADGLPVDLVKVRRELAVARGTGEAVLVEQLVADREVLSVEDAVALGALFHVLAVAVVARRLAVHDEEALAHRLIARRALEALDVVLVPLVHHVLDCGRQRRKLPYMSFWSLLLHTTVFTHPKPISDFPKFAYA